MTGELAELSFIEIADGIDGRGGVAKDGAIAEENFSFVTGAHDEPFEIFGLVVEDDHAEAGHDIAHAEGVCDGLLGVVGFGHIGNGNGFGRDAELVDEELGMIEGALGGGAIRHADGEDVFGAEGMGGKCTGDGGIDATREADDGFVETDAIELTFDEASENFFGKLGVDGEVDHR